MALIKTCFLLAAICGLQSEAFRIKKNMQGSASASDADPEESSTMSSYGVLAVQATTNCDEMDEETLLNKFPHWKKVRSKSRPGTMVYKNQNTGTKVRSIKKACKYAQKETQDDTAAVDNINGGNTGLDNSDDEDLWIETTTTTSAPTAAPTASPTEVPTPLPTTPSPTHAPDDVCCCSALAKKTDEDDCAREGSNFVQLHTGEKRYCCKTFKNKCQGMWWQKFKMKADIRACDKVNAIGMENGRGAPTWGQLDNNNGN